MSKIEVCCFVLRVFPMILVTNRREKKVLTFS